MPKSGVRGIIAVNRTTDLTPLLVAASRGEAARLDAVVPLVYDELRRIAHRALAGEARGHTLSTTALVHEAWLELARLDGIEWKSRAHFFALCGRLIRHVLVDYAVRRKAQKRGGGQAHVSLDEAARVGADSPDTWQALDEALSRLAAVSERQARVVECRFFAGMSVEETAEALDVSEATVKRDWALARAWLNRELSP